MFSCMFISILSMFRAAMCPSSGELFYDGDIWFMSLCVYGLHEFCMWVNYVVCMWVSLCCLYVGYLMLFACGLFNAVCMWVT